MGKYYNLSAHATQQFWPEMFILAFVLSDRKGSTNLRSMRFSHNGWTRHFSKWKPTTCFPIIMKQCFPNPPYHLFPAIVENWQSCKYQFRKSFYILCSLTIWSRRHGDDGHNECW